MDNVETESQEASGRAIFWALTAIAMNAMLQHSFAGCLTSNDSFDGSLWPHRSSPFICLYDMAMETWLLLSRRSSERDNSTEGNLPKGTSKATGAVMKLAVLVLGVLPQAAKLFSMSGIPLTQAMAAVFLLSSLVNTARSLRKGDAQQKLRQFIGDLKAEKSIWVDSGTISAVCVIHIACIIVMYHWLAERAYIAVSEDVENAIGWIFALCTTGMGIYALQHTAFMVINVRPPIPRSPVLLLLLLTDFMAVPRLVQTPEARKARNQKFQFTVSLLASAAVASFCAAYGLYAVARRLTKESGDGSSEAQAVTNEITSVITVGDEVDFDDRDGELSEVFASVPSTGDAVHSLEQEDHASQPSVSSTALDNSELATDNGTPLVSPVMANMDDAPNVSGTSDVSVEASKKEDPLISKIFVWTISSFIVPIAILLLYSGTWKVNSNDDSNAHVAEQGTAERGEATPSASPVSWRQKLKTAWELSTRSSIRRAVFDALQWPIRFALRVLFTVLWRVLLSLFSLFGYMLNWCQKKVQEQPMDILVLAFGIVNFVTASVYYLCLFDAEGMSSPGWNSIFG